MPPFTDGPKAASYAAAAALSLTHLLRASLTLSPLSPLSGVMPGDLDPLTSCHYLTTLKHAYLKLR